MAGSLTPAWSDQDEQDERPYALTGGRTRPRHSMRLDTLLMAQRGSPPERLGPEAKAAIALCQREQRAVAEIAAVLKQPAQVTKIILSDLIDAGALIVAVPDTIDPRSPQLLEALLGGIRHKWGNVA